jgi:hypothetical protein
MPGMVRLGDNWTGTCALGHPPGPYGPSLPGVPVPVTGTVIGTASTCLADGIMKAKVGIDIVLSKCGHVAVIVTGALKSQSEGAFQAVVGSIATAGVAPIIITGVIIDGSTKCQAN